MKGRRPGLQLDPKNPGPVSSAVCEVSSRGRLKLPAHLLAAVGWINAPKSPTQSLVVFDEPGHLLLLPWTPDGEQVAAKRLELIQAGEGDSEARVALQALETRYERIMIDKEFRITCSPEFLQHFRTRRGVASQLYVLRTLARIEVTSPDFRDKYLTASHELLDDLP